VVDRITFGGNYFDNNINNNYFHDLVKRLNQKFDNKIKYTENNIEWDIKRKLYLVGNEVRKGYIQETGKFTVIKRYELSQPNAPNNRLVRTGKPWHDFHDQVIPTSVLRPNFLFSLPAAQPER